MHLHAVYCKTFKQYINIQSTCDGPLSPVTHHSPEGKGSLRCVLPYFCVSCVALHLQSTPEMSTDTTLILQVC